MHPEDKKTNYEACFAVCGNPVGRAYVQQRAENGALNPSWLDLRF